LEISSLTQKKQNNMKPLRIWIIICWKSTVSITAVFTRNFFLYIKSEIQEVLTRLYKISHQEEILYRDILASLKRYTQLYNQVKNIANLLKQSREETNKELLAVMHDQDHYATEQLYTLKRMRDSLSSLFSITQYLSELERDEKSTDPFIGPEPLIRL
jgi:hypothetical protein